MSRATALFLAVTILLSGVALAATGIGDVDQTDLTGTDYLEEDASSTLVIKDAGGDVIPPSGDEHDKIYNDIPTGATIAMRYKFSLSDGDGTNQYTYSEGDHFTVVLPTGINFDNTTGTLNDGGFTLGDWTISGNTLTVTLGAEAKNKTGMGGAIDIDGTFAGAEAGDGSPITIAFCGTTITINRRPWGDESTLVKTGVYDALTNTISWTVDITPPLGTDVDYGGYTITDAYSENQTYLPGSFTVNGVADAALDATSPAVVYTFPDPTKADSVTGVLKVEYKTTPDGWAGASADFKNTAVLKNPDGIVVASDDDTVPVSRWITKGGSMVDPNADDPTIVKWTVDVTVPGDSATLSGATITDAIPAGLELITTDPTYPIRIKLGTSAEQTVTETMTAAGQYSYS